MVAPRLVLRSLPVENMNPRLEILPVQGNWTQLCESEPMQIEIKYVSILSTLFFGDIKFITCRCVYGSRKIFYYYLQCNIVRRTSYF